MVDGKPVILFVHGRGKEPKKSLEGGRLVEGKAVHKLEDNYDANVLMFNWDSKASGKDRSQPLSKMLAASSALTKVIEGVKQYRQENPHSKHISLLVHSMGNIVVENVVKNNGGWPATNGEPLFSNVLFSASDADNIGHSEWMEEVSKVEKTFITINAHDFILRNSTDERENGAKALGLEPGTQLAKNSVYIDLTKLGDRVGDKNKKHELFSKKNMHNQVNVCLFYQNALTGEPVVLNDQNSTEIIPGQRYKLHFMKDETNSCFK